MKAKLFTIALLMTNAQNVLAGHHMHAACPILTPQSLNNDLQHVINQHEGNGPFALPSHPGWSIIGLQVTHNVPQGINHDVLQHYQEFNLQVTSVSRDPNVNTCDYHVRSEGGHPPGRIDFTIRLSQ